MKVSLRRSISFHEADDSIVLDHSIWRFRLKKSLVEASPAAEFFRGHRNSITFDGDDKLFQLLRGQGCLTYPIKETYNSIDITEIFNAVSLDWYREYYQHNLWDMLREGNASFNTLAAWIIHNYHVSLNAGITHARIGVLSEDRDLALEHKDCALDEYWHADSFYFVKSKNTEINSNEVKNYIPLPASYSFQIHLRYLSEFDPIGYMMVSYFQERTIMFHEGSESFYAALEEHYDAPGLFNGWRKHISLDLELGHRDKRSDILKGVESIPSEQLVSSVNNARLAIQYLVICLDQILSFTDRKDFLSLRLPWNSKFSDNEFLGVIENVGDYLETDIDLLAQSVSKEEMMFIHNSVHRACFTMLGRAREHDAIMVAGHLAKIYANEAPFKEEVKLSFLTLKNHLWETAQCDFIACLCGILVASEMLKSKSRSVNYAKGVNLSKKFLLGYIGKSEEKARKVKATIAYLLELMTCEELAVYPIKVSPNLD